MTINSHIFKIYMYTCCKYFQIKFILPTHPFLRLLEIVEPVSKNIYCLGELELNIVNVHKHSFVCKTHICM